MTDTADRSYNVGAVRRALAIGPGSPREARTIDITTLGGRRSPKAHRDLVPPCRRPLVPQRDAGARSWYANLSAHPHFTFHLKNGVRADLPATAVPVKDPAVRHRVLSGRNGRCPLPAAPSALAPPVRSERRDEIVRACGLPVMVSRVVGIGSDAE
ncbi:hypothetical protein [Micromonospora sp. M61]|uniref:hypothetical protein n=1 Tax=Micromonospora sp. M61 TaxID=2824890 RepID=UPI001B38FC7F|nr:hypothetical protein [Micromonospora sp. M61]MBQ0981616.1 hypothetical protein [Micromonospora sp. M61]